MSLVGADRTRDEEPDPARPGSRLGNQSSQVCRRDETDQVAAGWPQQGN
jgi:hypothetical protein